MMSDELYEVPKFVNRDIILKSLFHIVIAVLYVS